MKKQYILIFLSILLLTSCQFSNRAGQAGQTSISDVSSPAEGTSAPRVSPEPGEASEPETVISLDVSVTSVNESGDSLLSCNCYQLLQSGMGFCDLIAISTTPRALTIPICLKETDVDLNMPYLQFDENSDQISLRIHKGNFAQKYNIASGCHLTLSLHEKNGYRDSYFAHQFTRSERREDYTSDAVFANFRMVRTSGIRENTLYRSSNPLGHKIHPARSPYADRLLQKSGIKTVINLANSKSQIQELLASPVFNSPAYQTLLRKKQVFSCHASTDLTSEQFTESLIHALKFMAQKKGPYLIHCNEGKDRTGVTIALLECLCGASLEEVTLDYMQSFENFYGITRKNESWQILAEGNILTTLSRLFVNAEEPEKHIKELESINLSDAAGSYLQEHGLTLREVKQIQSAIGT